MGSFMHSKIKAFVGHSFAPEDKEVINKFTNHLDSLKHILEWEHAEGATPLPISQKVKTIFSNKTLFIGIFTRKYPIRKWLKTHWLPSLWIIQESGYALGKGMDMIFLVENSIPQNELSGLHADKELIFFSRNNPAEAFTKLGEMLNTFLEASHVSTPEPATERTETPPAEDIETTTFAKWFGAIKSKDASLEESLYRQQKDALKDSPSDLEELEVKRHWLKAVLGDGSSFEELRKIAANSEKHHPNYLVAGLLEMNYSDYRQAYDYYKKAFSFADTYNKKAQAVEKMCLCLSHLSKESECLPLAQSLLFPAAKSEEEKARLFLTLANVAKQIQKKHIFCYFAERALSINPANDTLRFSLAYAYSELGEHPSAISHYKVLIKNDPNGTNYNNLAVSYSRAGLSNKANSLYEIAWKQHKSTLAAGNLAQNLLTAGFPTIAKEIAADAQKEPDYDNRINYVLENLSKTETDDEEKAKGLLSNIEALRDFKNEFADLFLLPALASSDVEGAWESTSLKDINFTLSDKHLGGTASKIGLAVLFKQEATDSLHISGEVYGRTAIIQLRPKDSTLRRTLLGETSQKTTNAAIFFRPDNMTAEILEIVDDTHTTIHKIQKKGVST